MQTFNNYIDDLSQFNKIILLLFIVGIAHLLVIIIRRIMQARYFSDTRASLSKTKTIAGLLGSILIFTIYFTAIGLILKSFGISLTAYLASASIIGLAIGFGSQGMVQDVVTGITVIFSDLFDIGDLVEISGQVGIVQQVGMRFTVLQNAMGAEVYIPNRTLTNVINYPRGYIRAIVDIRLTENQEFDDKLRLIIEAETNDIVEQLPGIFRAPPENEGVKITSNGKQYSRMKFRLWPGRGGPLETTYKQELLQEIKEIKPDYADWMITINYEVAERRVKIRKAQ
jgi:small conductance mechanosensitive channel